ncbi:MAG TPA: SRPBCC family protein [Candidatus Udaeobacter sp.]|jgi:uncharacterized protein YndB with AHSA1/START domain|nr:SRPBCC family protein [Candidatus Udaeobacter sp.]
MKWILRILSFVILVAVLLLVAGFALPEHTTHTRTITLKQPPEKVFAVLSDVPNLPKWNRNMANAEILAPRDGKETARESFKDGMSMIVVTTESSPPSHLVRTITEGDAPFTGSWSYAIATIPDGSQVALTEKSDIPNPFFRVAMKIIGPTKYMDQHLEDLAKKFGETAIIR